MMTSHTNGHDLKRPDAAVRYPTAPSVMTMNGHFAGVGDAPTKEQYEHGIQVIDDEKEFKCVPPSLVELCELCVLISEQSTY
jgi:hypothetical protein